ECASPNARYDPDSGLLVPYMESAMALDALEQDDVGCVGQQLRLLLAEQFARSNRAAHQRSRHFGTDSWLSARKLPGGLEQSPPLASEHHRLSFHEFRRLA